MAGERVLAGPGGCTDHLVLHVRHPISSSQQPHEGDSTPTVIQVRSPRPRQVECLIRSLGRASTRWQGRQTPKGWVLTTGPYCPRARCLPNPTGIRASLSLGPSLGRECWELVLAAELDSEGVPSACFSVEASPKAFVLRSLEWGGASFPS